MRREGAKRSRDDHPVQSKMSNSAEILVAELVHFLPGFDSVGWRVVGFPEATHKGGERQCPTMVWQMEVQISMND
jgi:hypothetical protein